MARLPRLTVPHRAHYVVQTAVHGQVLAVDDEDRRLMLDALQRAAIAQGVAIWGYALLQRELQLVVSPPAAEALGRMMQTLGRRYVVGFNRRHGRAGALWSGRFRAAVLQPGDWVLAALCQVDRLALDEGAWSSAPHHLGQRHDPMLVDPPELWALGNTPFERETVFRELLGRGVDPGQAAMLARAVHGAWVAGSPAFIADVAAEMGRPAAPRRAGRPKSKPSPKNV